MRIISLITHAEIYDSISHCRGYRCVSAWLKSASAKRAAGCDNYQRSGRCNIYRAPTTVSSSLISTYIGLHIARAAGAPPAVAISTACMTNSDVYTAARMDGAFSAIISVDHGLGDSGRHISASCKRQFPTFLFTLRNESLPSLPLNRSP